MASNHKYSIPDTNYIIKRIHCPKYQEDQCIIVLLKVEHRLPFLEWRSFLPSATVPVSMAGPIFLGLQPWGKSFGLSPFLQWPRWQSTSVAGFQLKLISLTPQHTSTVKQFTTSTVSTSLVSSTEPIELATFPKVVFCNKYQLRYGTQHIQKSAVLLLINF